MVEPSEPNGQKPPPKCKAILLCDYVILDARTGKHSIIGVFDQLNFASFPAQLPPLHAFVQLVDGIGVYLLRAEIHDLREDAVLARLPDLRIEFPPRTNRANLTIALAGLQFPHDGAYDFVVFADDQEIDRQRIDARLIGANPDADAPADVPDGDGE